jgi:uroporphyrin-III C-methyltransferase / precorrin-2 dehydrogenase / sirohydrochlorin ferrochelatase
MEINMSRIPTTQPAPIGELATLPVFYKLKGKKVLLVGNSQGALWKLALLQATGAEVLHLTDWTAKDFNGATLAIIDAEQEEAEHFYKVAKIAHVPVNCVDKPELCDFSFGAIVNRSPLIIAISTDGAAPVLGQAVRGKIESLLPQSLKNWANYAVEMRKSVQAKGWDFAKRRRFWENFTHKAFTQDEVQPLELIDTPVLGRVTLVGAGPGDPELLTLKALKVLQAADVILYDDLVSPEVLELARREATRICVGKRGHRASCKQSDIIELMLQEARLGRHVVRLKCGDPMIFGRAGEEIDACQEAGMDVSVVSGISTAQAASASLKRSLTHRDHARRVQYVTAHDKKGKLPSDLNWQAMADIAASTVLYMPRKTLNEFAKNAIQAGLPKSTPAVAVISASQKSEMHINGTIGNLAGKLALLPQEEPAIILIGNAFAQTSIKAVEKALEMV